MWLFWLIVLAVAAYWLIQRGKQANTATPGKPHIAVTVTTSALSRQDVPIGFQPTHDGGFEIGSHLSFPLTLYGLTQDEAEKLVSALERGQQYEISEWFTHLVAQKNIRCKELDDWLAEAKPKVRAIVKERILASTEWAAASDLDKQDLLAETQDGAVGELGSRPGNYETARILLLEEPRDLTVDDALLEKFKDNPQTYSSLLYAISAGSKVRTVPAGDYSRKTYEELHQNGFMRRGADIALEDMMASMTMKQMQEIAGVDAPKKFTRKAHAIDFLKSLPDIRLRLEKAVSFREMFQLASIEGLNLDELAKAHAYSNEVARVILRTLRGSVSTQKDAELSEDLQVDGWVLDSGDCCPDCRKLDGKTWKRLPKKLPPFHIGCEARIRMQ